LKQLQLTYLGTNTVLFEKGSSSLLVDPHFTRPRLWALLRKIKPDPGRIIAALRAFEIEQVDGVLLTHTHYDHALDAVDVVRTAGGVLCGSQSAVNLARGGGLTADHTQRVAPGDELHMGDLYIRFHTAQHIHFPPPAAWLMPDRGVIKEGMTLPAMFWQYACGDVLAIQVDRVLIFGSAACQPGAYAGLDIDTVILGIGGLELKPQAYLEALYHEIVLASGASRVLLSHWDNFFRPLDDGLRPLGLAHHTIRKIKALADRDGLEVTILPFGTPVEL